MNIMALAHSLKVTIVFVRWLLFFRAVFFRLAALARSLNLLLILWF